MGSLYHFKPSAEKRFGKFAMRKLNFFLDLTISLSNHILGRLWPHNGMRQKGVDGTRKSQKKEINKEIEQIFFFKLTKIEKTSLLKLE